MDRVVSLSKTYGEDAEEMKQILTMFSGKNPNRADHYEGPDLFARIICVGVRKTAKDLASEGMALAELGADAECPGWGDMAISAVKRFCQEHHTAQFRAEIVRIWAKDLVPVKSLRAWGPVMLRAAKMGLIRAVGYEKTTNPLAHATPATLWAVIY